MTRSARTNAGFSIPAAGPVTVCAVLLAALLVTAVAIRQSHAKAVENPNDFVTLYAGSICMTHACNPYSVDDLDKVLTSSRGTKIRQDWSDQLPIYPPTTLILLLPFSHLSYQAATITWYSLSLAVYAFGLCWLYLVSPASRTVPLIVRGGMIVLGLYFPKMLQCLGFGNPSVIVTGLLLFSVFDDAASRRPLQLAALFIACLLKPPLALPLAMLTFFKDPKDLKKGLLATASFICLFVAMTLVSSVPTGMEHWSQNLRQNLTIGYLNGMSPSRRVSPSNAILNLDNIPGYFTTNLTLIRSVSFVVVILLAFLYLIWLYRLRKGSSWITQDYPLAVAALAVITLLPTYHRFCDIGILLLAVPWVVREVFQRPRWQALLSAPILLLLYFSWERRIHIENFAGAKLEIVRFFYYRGDALLIVALSCVLLSAMYSAKTRSVTVASP